MMAGARAWYHDHAAAPRRRGDHQIKIGDPDVDFTVDGERSSVSRRRLVVFDASRCAESVGGQFGASDVNPSHMLHQQAGSVRRQTFGAIGIDPRGLARTAARADAEGRKRTQSAIDSSRCVLHDARTAQAST